MAVVAWSKPLQNPKYEFEELFAPSRIYFYQGRIRVSTRVKGY